MLNLDLCKKMVVRYANRHSDLIDERFGITEAEVSISWFSRTLNNAKVLLTTTLPDDLYYEVTYDGNKDQYNLEVYRRVVTIVSNSKGGVIS